jgi:hypothetical protein
MRELPDAPTFTAADMRAVGWTRSARRNALERGQIVSVGHNSFAPAQPVTLELRVRAAAHRYPRAVVSHRSALLIHGLPLVGTPPKLPEVTVAPRSNANLAGVHVHRAGLRSRDVATTAGLILTSPARTLVDVARMLPVGMSVPAIDAALHEEVVTLPDIEDCLRFCWNWPGIRRAQRAVRLADGRAESPLESVSRLVFGWLRLPPPEPQKWIFDQHGRIVARTDFYWDEYGVFGEADGKVKYALGGEALLLEKERHESLEDLGLTGVRWGWSHVQRRREALRTKILNAFERGAARDRSGLPRKWLL